MDSAHTHTGEKDRKQKKVFNYHVSDAVTQCEASIQATTALVDQAAQTSFRLGEQTNNVKWVMRKLRDDSAREYVPECTISLLDL